MKNKPNRKKLYNMRFMKNERIENGNNYIILKTRNLMF